MFKSKVYDRVREHFNFLQKKGYDVICIILQGSQNYDLDEYSEEYMSDVDTKSIVVPSLEDFVRGRSPISKTEELENGEHAEVKDIRVMFEMFKKMNISYIELLYSDYIYINPEWEEIILPLFQERELISSHFRNQFIRCIAGMAYEKRKALCHPYPTIKWKIDKWGYDGKQLSHCFRLLTFMMDYAAGKPLKGCFKPQEPSRAIMMNYKKQLDAAGRPLACEDAIKIADECVSAIKQLKDELLAPEEYINFGARAFLDELQYKVIVAKMKKELGELE